MNKNFLLALITLFVIVLGCRFLLHPLEEGRLFVAVETISEKTAIFDIHAEYPQFSGLPKTFNKKISALVLSDIADFKKSALLSDTLRHKSGMKTSGVQTYTFRLSWLPDQVNTDIVSFLVRTSSYTGGANPVHTLDTFTYDVRNGSIVTLDTLFGGVQGYLDRISQYTMNDLKNNMDKNANMNMIALGTAPKPENFSRFTLGTLDAVTFYFSEYQVAPYSAGEWKVVMPLSFIKTNSQ